MITFSLDSFLIRRSAADQQGKRLKNSRPKAEHWDEIKTFAHKAMQGKKALARLTEHIDVPSVTA